MPTPVDPTVLLERADAYLRDAGHLEQSAHGRYSCAMNALGCLCVARVGSDADQARVDAWEAKRYDPAAWPTVAQAGSSSRTWCSCARMPRGYRGDTAKGALAVAAWRVRAYLACVSLLDGLGERSWNRTSE